MGLKIEREKKGNFFHRLQFPFVPIYLVMYADNLGSECFSWPPSPRYAETILSSGFRALALTGKLKSTRY